MKKYEFYCRDCDTTFEVEINSQKTCIYCKKQGVVRVWNANFILKGKGFYKNDSRKSDAVS